MRKTMNRLTKKYLTNRDQMDTEELRTVIILHMSSPEFREDIETKNVDRVGLYNIIDRMFERTIEKVDWI
jgi:hypothetical protein